MNPFSHLLVGVDLSTNCVPAVKLGLQMSQEDECRLSLLYVLSTGTEEVSSFRKFYKEEGAEQKLLENYALPRLEDWIEEQDFALAEGTSVQARVGKPSREIVEYANNNGVDLVLTGTHGRTGWKRWWIGSVAERVLRTAVCPVLTVRSESPGVRLYDD